MLARDPFLDFLIGNTWLDGLLVAGLAGRLPTPSIVIAGANLLGEPRHVPDARARLQLSATVVAARTPVEPVGA